MLAISGSQTWEKAGKDGRRNRFTRILGKRLDDIRQVSREAR